MSAWKCAGKNPCSFKVDPPTNAQLLEFPEKDCRTILDLTVLLAVSQALQEEHDLRRTMAPVLEQMARHLGMQRCFITIYDREREELRIDQGHGLSREVLAAIRYKRGEGVIGRVMETGQQRVIRDIHACRDFLNKTDSLQSLECSPDHTTAFVSVPIRGSDALLGTINVFRTICRDAPDSALDPDVRLLTLIAAQIAQAVRLRQLAHEEITGSREQNEWFHREMRGLSRPEGMIGGSSVMQRVFFEIQQAAPAAATVLLRGESGVGKELVAAEIHARSKRAKGPFVAVNCAALPENLIESELFGHEKGAFTGAIRDRKGRFELANGGTLFLDEIGELPLSVQSTLLRALQEGTIEPVGGAGFQKVDVRIVAATNRPLEEMMNEGTFRPDLYYRLSVFPIFLPPLRQRKSDILPLADHFAEKYAKQTGKRVVRISTPAIDMLMSYHWPGNVRELENVIERSVLLTQDSVIHGYHLPASLQTGAATRTDEPAPLQTAIDSFEREMVVEALKATGGNMAAAARRLGVTERQMGLRVRKYSIDPAGV